MSAIESSEQLDKILPALLAAREGIHPAKKDAVNPHFKSRYADLAAVLDSVQGPLAANRIIVLNPIRPAEPELGGLELSCVLVHESGQWIRSRAILPTQLTAKPQEVGSAITYYRRYLLAALLSIATEDDDGEAATGRSATARPSARGPSAGRDDRPERPAPDGPGRPSAAEGLPEQWAGYCARECHRVNDEWANEMALANVPKTKRDDFTPLVNQHQLVNAVCTKAIGAGMITQDEVTVDGGSARDRSKATKAVSDLFARKPKSVKATVERYVLEKVSEARKTLGMTVMEGEVVNE